MLDQFWQRLVAEYLPLLQDRQKWLKPVRNFCAGDVVLIVVNDMPRGCWSKAAVEKTFPNCDGLVRRARLISAKGTLVRDILELVCLKQRNVDGHHVFECFRPLFGVLLLRVVSISAHVGHCIFV